MSALMTTNKEGGFRLLKPLAGILAGGLLLGFAGCSTTHQVTKGVEESGFLGDYSQLQKGVKDRAAYYYIKPGVDWSKYNKVMIRSVELWRSDDPDSPLGKLSPENQQMLVNFFHTAIYDQLSIRYTIVDAPGPDVLVIHAAITEARKSKPVINLISSVYPAALVLSYGKQLIWGTGSGVGVVTVEGEILDGQTNERLAAAVDRRAGTKAWRTKFSGRFKDAKLDFDWWAKRLALRLDQEKAGSLEKSDL
jgi:hypothetical protein